MRSGESATAPIIRATLGMAYCLNAQFCANDPVDDEIRESGHKETEKSTMEPDAIGRICGGLSNCSRNFSFEILAYL